MKHFTRLFFTLLLLWQMSAFAQVSGDFRSISSGDWGSYSIWQVYNGTSWVNATFGQIPGGSSESNTSNVYIEAGHTVSLTADQNCKDLHLNTTADVVRINTQNAILNVWGKMRFYEGTAPGASTPSSVISSGVVGWISTGTTGAIRFRGTADRVIMADGQINSNNTNSGWNLDFAFDPGFTGEIKERLRAGNITVSSGTLYVSDPTGELRIGTNNGAGDVTPNGNFLVKSGATVTGGSGIFKKSNVAAASITVEAGGNLIVTQNNFILAAQSLNLFGTLTLQNAISFPAITGREATAVVVNTFNNLVLSGTGAKVLVNNITVNGALTLKDQATLNAGVYAVSYGSSGELVYNGSVAQTTGAEFPASGSPSKLTINNVNGVTLSASRTVANEFTLSSGLLYLGNQDLTLGSSVSQVAGTPSVNNMVVTNGTGKLNKIFSSTGSFAFPIGDTTGVDQYSPGNITLNSASAFNGSTYFGARVIDTLHASTAATTDKLSRYWEVATNMTGYSYNGSFSYASQDVYGAESNIVSFLFADETVGSTRKALAAVNTTLHQIDFTNQNAVGFIGGSNFGCSITNNSISSASSSVCQGLQVFINGTAAVVTSGSPVYQWQVSKNGGAWVDAGVQEDYILADTTSFGQYSFRRVVSDPSNCAPMSNVTSNIITVDVYQNTSILLQPSDVLACPNTNVIFSAAGSGTNISYQWQVSDDGSTFTNISNPLFYSNVTSGTLTINSAPQNFSGKQYRLRVTGSCGVVYSTAAVLNVLYNPEITSQPVNKTICEGASTVFSTTATGSGLTYQWQVSTDGGSSYAAISNGGNYSNVNGPTLSVTGVASFNNYIYRCVVSGACGGPLYTSGATLKVLLNSVVTLNPSNVSACPNTNAIFSAAGSGTNISYQWQVSDDGSTFTNISNPLFYSNVTSGTLTINSAPQNFSGKQYRLMVTGSCGVAYSTPAVLSVLFIPQITSQPVSKTICEGANTVFSTTATGSGLTYQWQVSTNGGSSYDVISNGGNYSNVNGSSLLVTGTASINNYIYRCAVSGACGGPLYTSGATLKVLLNAVVTLNPSDVLTCPNTNVNFTAAGSGTNTSYQWQVSNDGLTFTNISNPTFYSNVTSGTLTINSTPQNFSGKQYRLRVTGSCGAIYSTPAVLSVLYNPQITSQPVNKTICEGTNTVFTTVATGSGLTYQWQVSTDGGNSYNAISNGGNYSNVNGSSLSVTGVASLNNFIYRCAVSGACGGPMYTSGATLKVSLNSVVTSNPSDVIVNANSNVNFTATGTGNNIVYLWQVSKNGGSIYTNLADGAVYNNVTTNNLSLVSVPASYNNYLYRLRITGSCSFVYTTAAKLEINGAGRVSLDDNETAYKVYTYPNPFNVELSIQIRGFQENATVVLRNLEGKIVSLDHVKTYNGEIKIGRDLPSGIYILEVMDDNHREVQKVVKSE